MNDNKITYPDGSTLADHKFIQKNEEAKKEIKKLPVEFRAVAFAYVLKNKFPPSPSFSSALEEAKTAEKCQGLGEEEKSFIEDKVNSGRYTYVGAFEELECKREFDKADKKYKKIAEEKEVETYSQKMDIVNIEKKTDKFPKELQKFIKEKIKVTDDRKEILNLLDNYIDEGIWINED